MKVFPILHRDDLPVVANRFRGRIGVLFLLSVSLPSDSGAAPIVASYARHLPAEVVSSAELPVPEQQRIPFQWAVTTITTADKPPLILKWDTLPDGAKPTHLRVSVGLDKRDEKRVEVVLPQSGRVIGTLEVAKNRQDIEDLVRHQQRLSEWIMKQQRADGLWSVIVTEPSLTPDTSGSAGIAAALAKGARLGWLSSEASDSARRAFVGVQQHLTADGFLGGASQSNKGGLGLQRSDYRVLYQMGMGLTAQLAAALETVQPSPSR